MFVKTMAGVFILMCFGYSIFAQGCSDAGFCTVGDFNANRAEVSKKSIYRNEIDFSLTLGTHGKNERFYRPQINYRFIKKKGGFFEFRLPLGIAKDKSTGISNTGIGDVIATYNSKFVVNKKDHINYSLGMAVSFSSADKFDMKNMVSYPMFLQNGLGTTDLIAVANYEVSKYLSISTGLQVPVVQYNKNITSIHTSGGASITAEGYRRKPDGLLKLSGHFQADKLKISGGLLSIFHFGNDYYHISSGKYILEGSKGTTINWNIEFRYSFAKKCMVGFLLAEPLKTRKNIPDGLARSRIFTSKFTYAF